MAARASKICTLGTVREQAPPCERLHAGRLLIQQVTASGALLVSVLSRAVWCRNSYTQPCQGSFRKEANRHKLTKERHTRSRTRMSTRGTAGWRIAKPPTHWSRWDHVAVQIAACLTHFKRRAHVAYEHLVRIRVCTAC